jgi:lactoylglutathione lyase
MPFQSPGNSTMQIFRQCSQLFALALILAVVGNTVIPTPAIAADAISEFSSPTIDLGCVVADVAKSVKFYTEVVGFKEVAGLKVPGVLAAAGGLTNGQDELDIHVLSLGEGAGATKLKLMQFPGGKSKKSDNATIDSQLGFRYLTIYVTDTAAAMTRLQKAGVKPLAKGPVALPDSLAKGMSLTVVRDPDGNFVELIGPIKK